MSKLKAKDSLSEIVLWCRSIVLIYTMVMLSAFPFYLRESYKAARTDKYHFFIALTTFVAVLVGILVFAFVDKNRKKSNKHIFLEYCGRPNLNVADIALLFFWCISLISALFATFSGGDFLSFFTGDDGRNMGFLMISMLVLAYFLISRLFWYKKRFFIVVLVAMAIMSIIAVVNFYYFDPLRLFVHYKSNANVIKNFTTTIGNKNYLSAMICITLPLAMGIGIVTKDTVTRIISYVCVGIQFMALIVATSDGGFLGCFVGLAIMLLFSSKDLKKLSRYFECVTIILVSSKLLWLFDLLMKGNNKGYSSFSSIFVYDNRLFFLIPFCVGLAILFAKLKDKDEKITKGLFISVLCFLIIIAIVIVSLFVYFSKNTNVEAGEFTSFFRFDENWGTHRGFFWINSFEMFEDFTLREKLFGVGPDNFVEPFLRFDKELIVKYNETHADAAHNVYINYLVTNGILGVTAYLLFIVAALCDVIRNANKNPLSFAVLGAIVAFVTQDIVNIANPVNTPWLFIMIAISQACYLKNNTTEYCEEVL